jgi:hypothetical protein
MIEGLPEERRQEGQFFSDTFRKGRTPIEATITTTKKSFARRFKMGLGGGQKYEPPRLMPVINRGGCFLLTTTVTMNCLAKSIYEGGYKIIASLNILTEASLIRSPPLKVLLFSEADLLTCPSQKKGRSPNWPILRLDRRSSINFKPRVSLITHPLFLTPLPSLLCPSKSASPPLTRPPSSPPSAPPEPPSSRGLSLPSLSAGTSPSPPSCA